MPPHDVADANSSGTFGQGRDPERFCQEDDFPREQMPVVLPPEPPLARVTRCRLIFALVLVAKELLLWVL